MMLVVSDFFPFNPPFLWGRREGLGGHVGHNAGTGDEGVLEMRGVGVCELECGWGGCLVVSTEEGGDRVWPRLGPMR